MPIDIRQLSVPPRTIQLIDNMFKASNQIIKTLFRNKLTDSSSKTHFGNANNEYLPPGLSSKGILFRGVNARNKDNHPEIVFKKGFVPNGKTLDSDKHSSGDTKGSAFISTSEDIPYAMNFISAYFGKDHHGYPIYRRDNQGGFIYLIKPGNKKKTIPIDIEKKLIQNNLHPHKGWTIEKGLDKLSFEEIAKKFSISETLIAGGVQPSEIYGAIQVSPKGESVKDKNGKINIILNPVYSESPPT